MEVVTFEDADAYAPDEGWERVSMAGSDSVSVEWFTKPPGHASPMHAHANEQVCLVLQGRLVIEGDDGAYELGELDSVRIESDEPHSAVNPTDEPVTGVDIFAPGRSFDFWTEG